MPTTTNYGWTTPADTDLVKDGASAIRTLGTAIDTTTKNLNPETTLGDISYRSSTANTNTRLALGTAGQVLTVNSGATAPEWATISAGGMTLISTTALSATSTISLTSIPGTYKHLQIVWVDVYNSSSDKWWTTTFNNDTNTNYFQITGTIKSNSTAAGVGTDSLAQIGNSKYTAAIPTTYTAASNGALNGTFTIFNYASTTLKKSFYYTFSGYSSSDNVYHSGSSSGVYNQTTAITRLDFTRNDTQTVSGTLQLWGLA